MPCSNLPPAPVRRLSLVLLLSGILICASLLPIAHVGAKFDAGRRAGTAPTTTMKQAAVGPLAVAAAQPIQVSGYNQDVVVDAAATSPYANFITASMDNGTAETGATYYEKGFVTAAPTTGLPMGTTFTSALDGQTVFQLQPVTASNALLLDDANTTGTLTLSTPAAYDQLSILTATGSGDGTLTVTLKFQGGATQTFAAFTSPDWFNNSPVAYTASGRISNVANGSTDSVGGTNPRLYQLNLPLTARSRDNSLTGIQISRSTGAGHTAIFAVSGSLLPDLFTSFVVNTTADTSDGSCDALGTGTGNQDCTLREAMTLADNDAGAESITFTAGVRGTINLTGALPDITSSLTIQGPGPQQLTVRRNTGGGYRIFTVIPDVTVNINGLKITNGSSGAPGGGGIDNAGNLTVTNSVITGNYTAGTGGGLNNRGTMIVTGCAITDNLNDNLNSRGGGISNESGTLTVENSTISGNTCINGQSGGGGISNLATLTVTNSTISSNLATFNGGGILLITGSATLTSVTITNNHAFVRNNVDPTTDGGGIYAGPNSSQLLRNCIVADNYRGVGTTIKNNIVGSVNSSSSFNLIGTGGAGGLTNGTNNNQVGVVNPGLGPLASNGGGPLRTHAPRIGSPAVDKGSSFGSMVDQRGLLRPFNQPGVSDGAGDAADIGAVEHQQSDFPVAAYDFEGDAVADAAVFRPSEGNWYFLKSGQSNSLSTIAGWGNTALGDLLVPADYDGDGRTDAAVFRPSEGNWYIINSATNTVTVKGWGVTNDKPVPADYDGDGKADVAIFRPAEGNWYILNSQSGAATVRGWGNSTDKLVPADYDGDGRADMAVYRPSESNWYIIRSDSGSTTVRNWGLSTDQPVPADYDADGKADFAVWRPSEGNWYIIQSVTNATTVKQWGQSSLGDRPVPADYDGDGRADIAVWREPGGEWWVIQSGTNTGGLFNLGAPGDTPIPAALSPQ